MTNSSAAVDGLPIEQLAAIPQTGEQLDLLRAAGIVERIDVPVTRKALPGPGELIAGQPMADAGEDGLGLAVIRNLAEAAHEGSHVRG